LPVGSNVPLIPLERAEARRLARVPPEALVLGFFGVMHGTRLLEHVREACEAVQRERRQMVLLYIGPDGAALRRAMPGIALLDCGTLSADEVSRRLRAVEIFLSPFIDGISTRRGSVMAALQHGLPVVGTEGWLTDAMLLRENGHAFLLSPAHATAEFVRNVCRLAADAGLREQIGQAGQELHEREFTWDRIADRLLEALAAAPPSTCK
jgi:glycosyltransferase involved in cell wall biosynthesis